MSNNSVIFGALRQWSFTLSRPLLSPGQRARMEADLAKAHRLQPDQVQLFFAGIISDVVLTLPETDPWRKLTGRFADGTAGVDPPLWNGAANADGSRFGTWRDATDLTPLEAGSVWDDHGLVEIADDLSPQAAAILAAGCYGWRECLAMIRTVRTVGAPREHDGEVVAMFGSLEYAEIADLSFVREACVDAVRWGLFRRQSYLGPIDEWPEQGLFEWAWRATRITEPPGWSDADVANNLQAYAVRRDTPRRWPLADTDF